MTVENYPARCDGDHIGFQPERLLILPAMPERARVEAKMSQIDYEAAVADFIRAKGITRCPTVCMSPTQASIAEADRVALRQLEEDREAKRAIRKCRQVAAYRFGKAA